MDYFFEKASVIFEESYVPSTEDYVRSSVPFLSNDNKSATVFKFMQRPQTVLQGGWNFSDRTSFQGIQAESDCTAFIFVCDLNSFRKTVKQGPVCFP